MTEQQKLVAAPREMPAFVEFVAMMASLMALTSMSIDIMLPALPDIKHAFDVGGANNQQLVVTDYVLGFSVGQIVFGPLSDRFGRRKVLLSGLALYAAASFLCMIAGSFELLLGARFLQGIANASPRVIALAVVRDVYGGRRMAEVMSFVMMIFIIVPVIAPSLGTAWLAIGSWSTIFAFLLAVSLAMLAWMSLRLPETHPPEEREALSLSWVGHAFLRTITTPQTLGYTLATGAIFGALMAYINTAEQIYTQVYGFHTLFPIIFGCVALSVAFASFLNSRLVGGIGMRRVSHGALFGFVTAAAINLVIALPGGTAPFRFYVVLVAFCLFFFGLMMPNFNSLAMEPMGHIAGTASSFVGAVTTGIAAALGWYVGQHFAGTPLPLLIGYLAFGALSLTLVLITERGRLFGVGQHDGN